MDFPIKNCDFYSYVKLPEGKSWNVSLVVRHLAIKFEENLKGLAAETKQTQRTCWANSLKMRKYVVLRCGFWRNIIFSHRAEPVLLWAFCGPIFTCLNPQFGGCLSTTLFVLLQWHPCLCLSKKMVPPKVNPSCFHSSCRVNCKVSSYITPHSGTSIDFHGSFSQQRKLSTISPGHQLRYHQHSLSAKTHLPCGGFHPKIWDGWITG